MRSILILGLSACAALGACAGPPYSYTPLGLVYQCGAERATIVYNGHGFLPGLNAPERLPDGRMRVAPRAQAVLTYRDREVPLMGDWTVEEGLRYRSQEAYDADHVLIWDAQGETALLSLLPIRAGPEPRILAQCERLRDAASLSDAPPAAEHSGNHAAPAGAPHRR